MKIALLLVLLTTLAQAELTLAQLKQRAGSSKLQTPVYYLKAAQAARAVFQKQGGLVQLPEAGPSWIMPRALRPRD